MTLYTNMPLELVLEGINDEREHFVEVWVDQVQLQVTPVAPGLGKIERVLQCSLEQYLNPCYTPGMLISYSGKAKQN